MARGLVPEGGVPEPQYVASDERIDLYLTVEADGEFFEHHLWGTKDEGDKLVALIVARLRDLGYEDDFTVIIDPGGEYDWIIADSSSLKALAEEIIDANGFVDQKG